MLIAAVLSLCAAAVVAAHGARSLARPAGPGQQVLRLVAPSQLAGALMLAAGGVVALSSQASMGVAVLVVAALGAIGTIAAGAWQGARVIAATTAHRPTCGQSCGSCALTCEPTQ